MTQTQAASEASGSPPLDTIKDKYNRGAAILSACPRSGSVLLETFGQERAFVNVNCMSWRCLGCRDRIRARFRNLVSAGVSTLGQCAFITITYQADSLRVAAAECVKKDWAALSRRLRKFSPWVSEMQWLRVMELTKRGVPHHHIVMGPIPPEKEIRCWKGRLTAVKFQAQRDCPCLAHVISLSWESVTGDSWVVHTIAVTSAKRAGGYMSKYMGKEFDSERAEALGMARRWSNSRGWPGPRRNRLKESKAAGGHGFRRVVYDASYVDADLVSKGSEKVMERMRPLTEEEKRVSAERFVRTVRRRLVDAEV